MKTTWEKNVKFKEKFGKMFKKLVRKSCERNSMLVQKKLCVGSKKSSPERDWKKFKSWGMSFKKNWNNLEKKLKLEEKFGKIFGKIGEKSQEKFYVGTQKVICQ